MAADNKKLNLEKLEDDDLLFVDEETLEEELAAAEDHTDMGEEEQISHFVRGITMVRCERYNANLTANGCQRKKEALPPRVKNAAAVDDENIQNHPCFGCLGPILISWPEDRPSIILRRSEKKSLISHPYFDNSLYQREVLEEEELARRKAEARRLQLKREEELMQIKTEVFDEDLDLEAEFEREMQADAERAAGQSSSEGVSIDLGEDFSSDANLTEEVEVAAAVKEEVAVEPVKAPVETAKPVVEEVVEPAPAPAKKSTPRKKKTTKKKTAEVVEEPAETKEPEQLTLGLGDADNKPKQKKPTKATKKKTSTKKKTPTKTKEEATEAADSTEAVGDHPPCVDCGRAYEGKYMKHWRGEICNPCYAKRLREKKKKQKSKQEKPKKEEGAHAPCVDCGRAYEGKYVKHWRGEICNPCYAKRLRNKKKKK